MNQNIENTAKGWVSASGVIVNIQPFMNHGWIFTKLTMTEVIGGKIAGGSISFQSIGSSTSIALITEINYITINIQYPKGGIFYDINGFITTKQWTKNVLDIKFICIPDHRFISQVNTALYNDPTEALKQLWGNQYEDSLKIRCETDLNDGVSFHQLGESNYSLCKKLALSFKKNSIFCFGVEGFMIKDIIGINSHGGQEPEFFVLGDGEVIQTSSFNLNYNYKIYKPSENPWEGEDYSENTQHSKLTALTVADEYFLVNKDQINLLDNYIYNKNIMESKLQTSLTVMTPDVLPNFKIGDTIKYKRNTDETTLTPFETFFVSKMSYFISTDSTVTDEHGRMFSVSAILRGIGNKGSELSQDYSIYDPPASKE